MNPVYLFKSIQECFTPIMHNPPLKAYQEFRKSTSSPNLTVVSTLNASLLSD